MSAARYAVRAEEHGHRGHIDVNELVAPCLIVRSLGYLDDAADAGRDVLPHAGKGEVPVGRYPLFDCESHVPVGKAQQFGRAEPFGQEFPKLLSFPTKHLKKSNMRAVIHNYHLS